MDWPEAGDPPNNNVVGIDPRLTDPANGEFAPAPGSPAIGYGCQTFPPGGPAISGSPALCLANLDARGNDTCFPVHSGWTEVTEGACSGEGRSSLVVSGDVTTDTVWDADTVRVVGDVSVLDGVTLTVGAGTRVEFSDFYRLTVLGRLVAAGNAEDPITFTTDEPWAFAPDTTTAGCWNGIRFPWTSSLNGESRLEYCVIEHSKALGDEPWGGALSVEGFSDLLIRNCILRDNAAAYGGAVFCSHHAAPEFVGTLMEGNSAFLRGAAVYSLYSYPDLTNCTIVGNVCLNDEAFDETGAIHSHISKPRTTSSIVRDNTSTYFIPTEILRGKAFYTTFSNIGFGHEGEGNIDEPPQFVDWGEHPFALMDGSPCVNAGRPDTAGLRLPALDVAGEVRVDDGRVDMGSYEGSAGTGVDGSSAGEAPPLSLSAANPLRGSTDLSFATPGGEVTLAVYDVAGHKVRTLFGGVAAPGTHHVGWDCRDSAGRRVAAGVYFCRLECGGESIGRKLVLTR
jgi:hypothetical protein